MEDFPLWLKILIYLIVGLTGLYASWGVIHSFLF